jgi:IclR family pca regulon transcriptional regulator
MYLTASGTAILVADNSPYSRPVQFLDHTGSCAEPQFKYVQSLERGLAIIAAFNEHHPQLTLAEVGRATGLDRSTARRFLLTLKALGYVEQNDRYFFLAPRTLQLGYRYLASLPWWRAAQNISERMTNKIGASSAVGVLDHDSIVYVAYASAGRFPLLMGRSVGTHLPAITTAIGCVLLAELGADEIHQHLAAISIEQYTPGDTNASRRARSSIATGPSSRLCVSRSGTGDWITGARRPRSQPIWRCGSWPQHQSSRSATDYRTHHQALSGAAAGRSRTDHSKSPRMTLIPAAGGASAGHHFHAEINEGPELGSRIMAQGMYRVERKRHVCPTDAARRAP